MTIRPETAADRDAVRRVHATAFDTPEEAALVDNLRATADPLVSLVAEEDGDVIGHVMLSPVTLPARSDLRLMGLAPLAVLPARQRSGVGAALTRAGLARCRELGVGAVFVLGHPAYYARFDFVPAAGFGIDSPFGEVGEAWMLVELEHGYLRGAAGTTRWHEAFDGL